MQKLIEEKLIPAGEETCLDGFDEKASFASANVFPIKLLHHEGLLKHIRRGKIPPIHIQLNPTNRCNLNCSFCSCSSRDKQLELTFDQVHDIMSNARRCGCCSVTITGGGEPFMHRRIIEIIADIRRIGINVGIVTNGILLPKQAQHPDVLNKVTWIRVSCSSVLESQLIKMGQSLNAWLQGIAKAVTVSSKVDWAFSYVIDRHPRYGDLAKIINFANEKNFTHVRLVTDLLDLEAAESMIKVKAKIQEMGVDDHLVIYQNRKTYTKGFAKCLISLLKPVIGADGWIYPCCGTQYALEEPSRDYERVMRMLPARNIHRLYEEQRHFDGSICSRCYYEEYNLLLKILQAKVRHGNFI